MKETRSMKLSHRVRSVLSGFLAVLMVVTSIPFTSFAAPPAANSAMAWTSVDGNVQQITSGIGLTNMNNGQFVVTMPDTASGAKWAGWGEDVSRVYAEIIDTTGDQRAMATAVALNDKALTFGADKAVVDYMATTGGCTVVLYGGVYKTDLTVEYEGGQSTTVAYGGTFQLDSAPTVDAGEVFVGWQDQDGVLYAAGSTVTVKKNMTFKAVINEVGTEPATPVTPRLNSDK